LIEAEDKPRRLKFNRGVFVALLRRAALFAAFIASQMSPLAIHKGVKYEVIPASESTVGLNEARGEVIRSFLLILVYRQRNPFWPSLRLITRASPNMPSLEHRALMLLLMLRFMSLLRHVAPEANLVLYPQLYTHVDKMERQHSGHIGSFPCQSPYKSKIYNQKFNLVLIYLPPPTSRAPFAVSPFTSILCYFIFHSESTASTITKEAIRISSTDS
jgi:hypothetical protein